MYSTLSVAHYSFTYRTVPTHLPAYLTSLHPPELARVLCTNSLYPTHSPNFYESVGKDFSSFFFLKKKKTIQQSPLTAQYHSVIDRYYRKFHPTQHPFPASKPVSHVQNAHKHTHHLPTPTHHVQPSTQWGLAKSEKNETGKRLLPNAYAWWEGSQAGKQDTQIDVVDREVKGWKRKKIYRIPPPHILFSLCEGVEFIGKKTNVEDTAKHRTSELRAKRR